MNIMKKIYNTALYAGAAGILAFGQKANADFYEAARCPSPDHGKILASQLQVIGAHTETTDLEKEVLNTTLKGKGRKVFGSVSVPYVRTKDKTTGEVKTGFGDIGLEAGIPLKKGNYFILPLLNAKLPTGEISSDQYSVGVLVPVTGCYDWGAIDATVGYTHNEKTDDQLIARLTPSVKLGNKWMVGLENIAVFDKKTKKFQTVPIVKYQINDQGAHVIVGAGACYGDGPDGFTGSVRLRVPIGKK